MITLIQKAARPARLFHNVGGAPPYSTLYADISWTGLTANDPVFLAVHMKADQTVPGGRPPIAIGTADTTDNQRRLAISNHNLYAESRLNSTTVSDTTSQTPPGSIFEDRWFYGMAEFASASSRRTMFNGVAYTEDTATITLTVAPTQLRLFGSMLAVDSWDGFMKYAAIFAGTVSANTIRQQAQGIHPLRWKEKCLECWDFSQPKGWRGLVRRTPALMYGTLVPENHTNEGAHSPYNIRSEISNFEGFRPIRRKYFTFGVPVVGTSPTSTSDAGSWTPIGAASLHAAVADTDDATLMRSSTGQTDDTATVSYPTIGGMPVTLYIRHRKTP